ncbi:MAG TPA: hypothetical protein VGB76_01520 [Pyrinomonadaceae bacterium]
MKIYFGKVYGAHMDKLKTIWLPRGKRVYVWQGLISTDQRAYDQLTAIAPNNAGGRPARSGRQNALLFKELEENNRWARLGANIYFGWFTLLLIINVIAAIWLFTYRGVRPPYARLVFLLIIGMNLTGTVVTFFIRKHMLDCDRRIKGVLEELRQEPAAIGAYDEPQSPVPRQVVNVMFAFTGVIFFMLFLFWMILEIWPHVFLT